MKLFLGLSAVALVIAVGLVLVWPFGAQAAGCPGRMVGASWYGAESGNRTASGHYFDGTQLLVAHKTLPLGTKVRITYRGKSIVVPVLDRGPFIAGREVDLSRAVAKRIGFLAAGVGKVCMEVL